MSDLQSSSVVPASTRRLAASGVVAGQRHISQSRYATGSLIVEEGEPFSGAFEILSGGVLLSRLTQDGKRHVLAMLGPGDVFGISDDVSYDTTAEAIAETTVCRLECALEVLAMRSRLVQQLMRQLKDARTHAVRLQRRSAEEKIASFILQLPAGDRCMGRSKERIMLSLTDTADYLFLRMETVSRVISKFKQRGLISAKARGRLTILDEARLAAIANPSD